MLDDKLLCGMSAFKAHCAFSFWEREGASEGQGGAMGDFGRIETMSDLPSARRAAQADQGQRGTAAGRRGPREQAQPRTPGQQLDMPADFAAALAKVKAARQHYDAFAASKQRDYLEWVLEAKREETRAKRVAQAVEWLAEGKSRNWKYEAC